MFGSPKKVLLSLFIFFVHCTLVLNILIFLIFFGFNIVSSFFESLAIHVGIKQIFDQARIFDILLEEPTFDSETGSLVRYIYPVHLFV